MKKALFFIPFLFIIGCAGNSANNADEISDSTQIEININDSLSSEIEKAKQEINQSSEKLDDALNNL